MSDQVAAKEQGEIRSSSLSKVAFHIAQRAVAAILRGKLQYEANEARRNALSDLTFMSNYIH
jgi:hypothetical protein